MRDLVRNQQTFWYAVYTGEKEPILDGTKRTGEWKQTYGDPVEFKANISPSRGYASEEVFGKDLQYDRTIMTCDMTCPITETSILWIDIEPKDSNDKIVPHNYIVTQVAKGLNNIVFAVKKVELR